MICDLSGCSDEFVLFYFVSLFGIEFRLVACSNVGLAFAFCVWICCFVLHLAFECH